MNLNKFYLKTIYFYVNIFTLKKLSESFLENVYINKISVANLIIVNFRKHLPDGKI
ncbi:hypothetical protein SDC9_87820 [bioreactor metagenome]|uniref:Uncharacterized protein n=1 Tax=bioreactor metagenome TaxID=1076179 RepID=A0A644ZJV7_9ZZZZ